MTTKGDSVLEKMLEYLEHAKNLLLKEGYLQPTVFALLKGSDTILVLPVLNEDNDPPDLALDIISKVLHAYNVSEYFVISESYRLVDPDNRENLQECLNVIHVAGERRCISILFQRLLGDEIFFGETSEIKVSNIEGSLQDLFFLKNRTPKLSERDKGHIRLLFPAQSEDELMDSINHTLH